MNTRPTRDATLLQIAEVMAARSTCSRAAVGAIVAREGRLLSSGYNGAPSGMGHCKHAPDESKGCEVAVHAEANAIAFAARYGVSLIGATLYTTYTPCLPCAQLIINAGIVRVVALKAYRDPTGFNLLRAAGIEIE